MARTYDVEVESKSMGGLCGSLLRLSCVINCLMIADAIFEGDMCSADEHCCFFWSVFAEKLISSHRLTLGHFWLRGMLFSRQGEGKVSMFWVNS